MLSPGRKAVGGFEPLVKWTNTFSVGIYIFDLEHMQLLALINDLYGAMICGLSESAVLTIIHGVTKFAERHFAHEEEFFAITHYAGSQEHLAEHLRLLAKIALFKEWCTGGDVEAVTIDLSAFLTQWFTEHTWGLDREFGQHLRKFGIR